MKKLSLFLMLVVVMSLTACEFKLWPESDDSDSDYGYDSDFDSDYGYDSDSDSDYDYGDTETATLVDVDPYVSVEGGFSVKFPGEPTLEIDPVPTDYGFIDMYFYMYKYSLYKAYMVAYADYPDEALEDQGAELILEGAAYGVTEEMTVDYYEDLAQTSYLGKSLSANDGVNYMDVDLYLVGNRLYQVVVMDFYGYATDGLEFLASFQLL